MSAQYWWVNPGGGSIERATAAQGHASGWLGPYSTLAEANAALASAGGGTGGPAGGPGSPGGGTAGTGPWWADRGTGQVRQSPASPGSGWIGPYQTRQIAQLALGTGRPAPSGAQQLLGVNAIGDFFSRLSQASTWIRVTEVVLGAALLLIGLAKLAAGTSIGKAAIKAGKAAAIL